MDHRASLQMIEHKDFIGYYHNLYPEGYCQHLIEQFNLLEEKGIGQTVSVVRAPISM
jgi:hypothetical protein